MSVATEECVAMALAYDRAKLADLRAFDKTKVTPDVLKKLDADGYMFAGTRDTDHASSQRTLETPDIGVLYLKSVVFPGAPAEAPNVTEVDHGVTLVNIHDSKGVLRVQGSSGPSDEGKLSWSQVFVDSSGTQLYRKLGTVGGAPATR